MHVFILQIKVLNVKVLTISSRIGRKYLLFNFTTWDKIDLQNLCVNGDKNDIHVKGLFAAAGMDSETLTLTPVSEDIN